MILISFEKNKAFNLFRTLGQTPQILLGNPHCKQFKYACIDVRAKKER
jgi:hypothetical protein